MAVRVPVTRGASLGRGSTTERVPRKISPDLWRRKKLEKRRVEAQTCVLVDSRGERWGTATPLDPTRRSWFQVNDAVPPRIASPFGTGVSAENPRSVGLEHRSITRCRVSLAQADPED